VHPDDFPQTVKAYYQAIQSGTSYHGVLRLRRADGEFRWHHARCEPLRDRQGRIIQWYGLSVDIDEAQLQAILNVIPAYTWYAAPSGGITFLNKRTADYLGLPKDHPLRFGIDVGAQWDAHIQLLHRTTKKNHAKPGQPVCARARPPSLVSEFVTLKEATAGSSVAPNRSGRAMEPYCSGSG
jgi:PAS domain-containing protein